MMDVKSPIESFNTERAWAILKALADMPVALSSELDDVSKKNYALNKSVRAVKKKCAQIDEMRAEIQQLQKKVATMEKKLATAKSSGNGGRKTAKAS